MELNKRRGKWQIVRYTCTYGVRRDNWSAQPYWTPPATAHAKTSLMRLKGRTGGFSAVPPASIFSKPVVSIISSSPFRPFSICTSLSVAMWNRIHLRKWRIWNRERERARERGRNSSDYSSKEAKEGLWWKSSGVEGLYNGALSVLYGTVWCPAGAGSIKYHGIAVPRTLILDNLSLFLSRYFVFVVHVYRIKCVILNP